MIANALELIRGELELYLKNVAPKTVFPEAILLENIASLETDAQELANSVLISLVNIEEESTFKNVPAYRQNRLTGLVDYENPPVFLNLYVLFSCTLANKAGGDRYLNALARLGLIIQFFQRKKHFTIHNSPNAKLPNANDTTQVNNLKIILDLYTLTFEQINHLWGSLGGRQVPFVMYKMRLVQLQDAQILRGGGVITEVQTSEELL